MGGGAGGAGEPVHADVRQQPVGPDGVLGQLGRRVRPLRHCRGSGPGSAARVVGGFDEARLRPALTRGASSGRRRSRSKRSAWPAARRGGDRRTAGRHRRGIRVDRIEPRTPTGPRFPPRDPTGGDPAAYVSSRVSSAAWRYRARVTVHAPAEEVAERINPAVGTVETLGDDRCVLSTGAETVETLAIHLALLERDFEVSGPPELVAHLARLAERYARATPDTGTAPAAPR
ncbi:WYL domain-containing protein [Streptomyces sp. NPDC060194]|uniref:WYL domain-containing protein n=1 Tax=Streptomyces sp. NPDC060194 TaxID=3347069 RepID=UPI0036521BAD